MIAVICTCKDFLKKIEVFKKTILKILTKLNLKKN